MTQAKHTPGPWTVMNDGASVEGANGRIIVAKPQGNQTLLSGSAEADAALIAAAPELLEALIRLDAYVRSFTLDATGWKKVAAARAAIAKAGGAA